MDSRQSADAAVAEKQQFSHATPKQPGTTTLNRAMHGLVILCSIIGIATAAALLAMTPSITVQRYNEDSGLVETVIGITALAILGIAAIWSIAELVTQLCKKWQSGIHPGAHVGVSLILWLAAIVCTGLFGGLFGDSVRWDYDYQDCEHYSRNHDGDYYSDSGHCPSESERSRQRSLAVATLVFLATVGVLSFCLFVRACYDTKAHNKARAARRAHKHSRI